MTCQCWKCREGRPCIRTVQISAAATPTRHPGAVGKQDARLSKDLAAYKRLRDAGTQPMRVNGSAQLEQIAHNKYEIETGTVWANEKDAKRAEQAAADLS